MKTVRSLAMAATALFLAAGWSTPAGAQADHWPSRTVRIYTQYGAGGSSDLAARLLAEQLQRSTGQPFVVEPKPGGGGNISSEFVARAKPDGYTLLMAASGPITANPTLYKRLSFIPHKDLMPISFVGSEMFALVANPASGISSVPDLIAKARAQPNKYSFASGGAGAGTHLTAELFKRSARVELLHVPYKGGVAALNDVLAGIVPMTFANVASANQYQKAGKLNVLAVSGTSRSPFLPQVPTMRELGLRNADSTAWYGIMGPAGIPPELAEKISSQFNAVLKDPAIQKRIAELGLQTQVLTRAEFGRSIQQDVDLWSDLITSLNLSLD